MKLQNSVDHDVFFFPVMNLCTVPTLVVEGHLMASAELSGQNDVFVIICSPSSLAMGYAATCAPYYILDVGYPGHGRKTLLLDQQRFAEPDIQRSAVCRNPAINKWAL